MILLTAEILHYLVCPTIYMVPKMLGGGIQNIIDMCSLDFLPCVSPANC